MVPAASRRGAMLASCALSAAAAFVLNRCAPLPAADVSRGTEDCFAEGLLEREAPPPSRMPQRWTEERAVFRFRHLPPGPANVRVEVHGHRAPVFVAIDGQAVGMLPRRTQAAAFPAPSAEGGALTVELRVEPFVASGGRRLGTLLDRVAVEHPPAQRPSAGLLLSFLVPAVIVTAAAIMVGIPPLPSTLMAAALAALQALALAPSGVVRSPYAQGLATLLSLATLGALAFALWAARRFEASAPWAFAAVLAAAVVQWAAATSPMMVVSDAVFHAHKLAGVAAGDLFPTSLTPGERPFRFPYGISFYALLAPLARLGLDAVTLVRHAAALSGVASSAVLFGMLAGAGARRAGLAVLGLQVLPTTFDLYSYGNLSNVFGQSLTVGFFGWWTAVPLPHWGVGAGLLCLGCLAHLSSFFVLVALAATLAARRGRGLGRERARLLAMGVGLGVALLYYARFTPLVLQQMSRLGEAGSAARPLWSALLRQGRLAVAQWGWPAIALGLLGLPRPRRGGLDPDLVAYWLAGGALAALALVSPIEVRYLHALTLPLAVALGTGADRLLGRGRWAGALAVALLCGQTALAVAGIAEGVLHRYRP
jgi:hypothetical protein